MKLVLTFLLALTPFCFSQDFWEKTNLTYSDGGTVLSLAINTNGDIFAGTNDGVYRSTDNGDDWTQINNGLSGLDVGCLTINSNGDIFAGTGLWYTKGDGVFRSTNNGDNWTQINNGLTTPYVWSLAINSNGDVFAGTDDYLFRSTDNGDNWIQLNNGLTDLNVQTFDVRCFVFNSNGDIFIGTDTGGMYRSTDNGNSWTQINNGLTHLDVWTLAINSEGDIFAGTGLWYGEGAGIFRTKDNDENWTQINNGLTNLDVESIAINSNDEIFAGTGGGGVFHSKDNGENWTQINNGLSELDVYSLAVDLEGYIYAGTGNGIWRRNLFEIVPVELNSNTAIANSNEITLSWSTATELNNQGFEVQRKFGSNDFVTIGSVKGNGTTTSPNQYSYVDKLADPGKYFYRLKQIDFNGTFEYSNEIEVEVRTLDKFALEQNYPNPVNPTTTIGFGIMEKGNVRLCILNILGEEIKVLLNEEKDAGYHSVDFKASELPSGVYLYRLQVYSFGNGEGKFMAVNKMILLR